MIPFKEKTVLIVDDEPALVRGLTKSITRFTDHNVITATNGEEALEIVKSNKHNLYFILSDIRMPKMNGVEFAQELKVLGYDIPILFITGNYDDFEEEISKIKPEAILKKPYSIKNFKEAIKRFMV